MIEVGKRRFRRAGRLASVAALVVGVVPLAWVSPVDGEVDLAIPLRALADDTDLRIGAAIDAVHLGDPDITATHAREFNSLTAENAMKWYAIEAERDVVDFTGSDQVLAFAEAHGQTVRGHTLVWSQDRYTPDWVVGLEDPDELWSEVEDHVRAVLERYRGRITRWDVVNEPLATLGVGPSDSVFARVLGPDWVARVFRLAHEVDPAAQLWLNEYGSDWVPDKHEALLALARELLDAGVPVDGIGLQTHRLTADGPDRAVFEGQLRDFAALGLDVAITELDVATSPDDPDALERQADAYRTIVVSCLAVPACVELTTWGVSDRDTWLDFLPGLPQPTRPLLFDDQFRPKPARAAVAEVLAAGRAGAVASSPFGSPPIPTDPPREGTSSESGPSETTGAPVDPLFTG